MWGSVVSEGRAPLVRHRLDAPCFIRIWTPAKSGYRVFRKSIPVDSFVLYTFRLSIYRAIVAAWI